jgi:tetratricopeptide (TPR) repeat protein
MELTIEQALQQGVAAHKEGKLQDAERFYVAILQSQPAHPDANHNLGVLAVSVNQTDVALPLFKTALEGNPKIEQFWLSYIDVLIKEKQFDNAKQVLEQAKTRGVATEKLNALEAQLSPKTQKPNTERVSPPQELLNSLLGHYQNGRFSDAEKLSVEITQDFPKHQFAWKVLGAVLGATGRKSEAVDANQAAVALSPQDAEAHSNLGNALQELGRLDEAEASCKQAIALKPDYAEAYGNLGNTLQQLGRLDEAEVSYNQAIALRPD